MPADTLGYLPDAGVLSALGPTADGEWRAFAPESGSRYYRMCTNSRGENVCNWMVSAEESENVCLACRFNQSIPDLSVRGHRGLWQRLEGAKGRLAHPVPFGFHGRYFADLRA